jgi:hypothetical protein
MYIYLNFFCLLKILFRLSIKKPAACKTADTAINTKEVSNVGNTKGNSEKISSINDLLGATDTNKINSDNISKNDREIINSIFCEQQSNSGVSKQKSDQNYQISNNDSNFFDFGVNKNNFANANNNQFRNQNLQKGAETVVSSNDLINSN